MNFFERQADGRRNSKILIALFALAVAGIVVAVDVAAGLLPLRPSPLSVYLRPSGRRRQG